jgi:transposase
MLGKNKSDMVDAQGIAEMVRHDELPLAYCYPAGMRATRDLLRVRRSLVKMRAMRLQHHQCTEDQYLLDEEPLEDAGYDRETIEDIRRSVRSDERCVEFLTGEIEELERHIRARAQIQDREMYELLTAVAGIGDILALTVLYEVHTIERFPRPQAFASYCRVVNPQHESGGKRSGSGNRRAGNRWLSWAMQEIVTYTCRYNPAVNAYYKGLEKKKGRRHARRILAHKWAVTIYHMMKKKEAFSWEKFVGTAPRGETMQTTGHASSAAHHAAPAV